MSRATIAFLFVALVLLALARWVVDGARWLVAPRRRPARVARVARAATAR